MIIRSLSLSNFRNFSNKKIEFDPKLTVIVGANGSGKSNTLEAIGLLAGMRLRKVDTDLDLVRFGQPDAKIESKVESSEPEEVTLTINFQAETLYSSSEPSPLGEGESKSYLKNYDSSKGKFSTSSDSSELSRTIIGGQLKKAYFVDGIKKRWVEFTNHMGAVEFAPNDLELISGSPSTRRHHLDSLLSSLDKTYWRSISSYSKVVIRRNKVLQRIAEGKSKKNELDFWDERLLEHGKYLTTAREEFFEFLNFVESARPHPRGVPGSIHAHPAGEISDYSWQLRQSVLSEEKLHNNRDRDIAAGVTLSGPHRDDFMFVFREKNLEYFGSRGEQRMAVLALKLAELEYYNSKRGTRPVLALDDIFSELDWEHREAVLSVIGNQQTIITAAEEESIPKEIFKKAKIEKI